MSLWQHTMQELLQDILVNKGLIQMKMSIQDLIKLHVNDKCKYCNRKNCQGIRVTQDGRTVCEVTEDEMFRNK